MWHAFVEGYNLDLAYPPPWEHHLAERNLAAVWSNYRALGYRRMIYVNTASVRVMDSLTAAMGDSPNVTAVLLTCRDATARLRLARREIGGALEAHIARRDVAVIGVPDAKWGEQVAAFVRPAPGQMPDPTSCSPTAASTSHRTRRRATGRCWRSSRSPRRARSRSSCCGTASSRRG